MTRAGPLTGDVGLGRQCRDSDEDRLQTVVRELTQLPPPLVLVAGMLDRQRETRPAVREQWGPVSRTSGPVQAKVSTTLIRAGGDRRAANLVGLVTTTHEANSSSNPRATRTRRKLTRQLSSARLDDVAELDRASPAKRGPHNDAGSSTPAECGTPHTRGNQGSGRASRIRIRASAPGCQRIYDHHDVRARPTTLDRRGRRPRARRQLLQLERMDLRLARAQRLEIADLIGSGQAAETLRRAHARAPRRSTARVLLIASTSARPQYKAG